MSESRTVRTPATSANLGPGFDSFGLALALFNTFSACLAPEWHVELSGQDAENLRSDESNPVVRAMRAAFEAAGQPDLCAHLTCENRVPIGRGLGSSAAAVVGGLRLGFDLAGTDVSPERILSMAAQIEGHPDNVAAAVYGGFVVAQRHDDGATSAFSLPIGAGLAAILVVSRLPYKTEQARELVPAVIPHGDAAYSASAAALLASGIVSGRADLLSAGAHDRLHEPYRVAALPDFPRVAQMLRDAGADGAMLSGAGPTVLGLVCGESDEAAYARAQEVAARAAVDIERIDSYDAPAAVRIHRAETT